MYTISQTEMTGLEMRDIVILGAGGLAREVAFLIEEINRSSSTWNLLGFVVIDEQDVGKQIGSYKVICTEDELSEMQTSAAIGMGNPATIQKIAKRFENNPNITFPNLVHPQTVWDRERITLGCGNIICAGTILTTDIHIGSFNCLNLGCMYGHDIQIGDYCVVNPGVNLSGGVEIGSRCLVGTGATVLQYLKIGDDVTIGAGALVMQDVASGLTVFGVPARPLGSKNATT